MFTLHGNGVFKINVGVMNLLCWLWVSLGILHYLRVRGRIEGPLWGFLEYGHSTITAPQLSTLKLVAYLVCLLIVERQNSLRRRSHIVGTPHSCQHIQINLLKKLFQKEEAITWIHKKNNGLGPLKLEGTQWCCNIPWVLITSLQTNFIE